MEVTEIENETFTKEYAEGWNRLTRAMPWKYKSLVKEGDILYGDIEIDGIIYKSTGQYREVDPLNKESVLATFDKHKKSFKHEYHWLFTRNQEGIYKFYRSAKILKTLQKECPEKFTVWINNENIRRKTRKCGGNNTSQIRYTQLGSNQGKGCKVLQRSK